jgi:hypothetical protein
MKVIFATLFFSFVSATCFALTPEEIFKKASENNLYGQEEKIGAYVVREDHSFLNDGEMNVLMFYGNNGNFRMDSAGISESGKPVSGISMIYTSSETLISRYDVSLIGDKFQFDSYYKHSARDGSPVYRHQQVGDAVVVDLEASYQYKDVTLERETPDYYVLAFPLKKGIEIDKLQIKSLNDIPQASDIKLYIDKKTFQIISCEKTLKHQLSISEKGMEIEDVPRGDRTVIKYEYSDFRKIPGTKFYYPYRIKKESLSDVMANMLNIEIKYIRKMTAEEIKTVFSQKIKGDMKDLEEKEKAQYKALLEKGKALKAAKQKK